MRNGWMTLAAMLLSSALGGCGNRTTGAGPSSIVVAPAIVAAGYVRQLIATGTYPDGSTRNVTASASWSSSNELVATVGSTGLAAGPSSGAASMTASLGGVAGSATLTVDDPPVVNGKVFAAAPDGSGGWYIGGQFTHVGGVARNNIAHLLADGSVDPAWNPNANSGVLALAVTSGTIFAGGTFKEIGGQKRNSLAALDASGSATASGIPTQMATSRPWR